MQTTPQYPCPLPPALSHVHPHEVDQPLDRRGRGPGQAKADLAHRPDSLSGEKRVDVRRVLAQLADDSLGRVGVRQQCETSHLGVLHPGGFVVPVQQPQLTHKTDHKHTYVTEEWGAGGRMNPRRGREDIGLVNCDVVCVFERECDEPTRTSSYRFLLGVFRPSISCVTLICLLIHYLVKNCLYSSSKTPGHRGSIPSRCFKMQNTVSGEPPAINVNSGAFVRSYTCSISFHFEGLPKEKVAWC